MNNIMLTTRNPLIIWMKSPFSKRSNVGHLYRIRDSHELQKINVLGNRILTRGYNTSQKPSEKDNKHKWKDKVLNGPWEWVILSVAAVLIGQQVMYVYDHLEGTRYSTGEINSKISDLEKELKQLRGITEEIKGITKELRDKRITSRSD